MPSGSISSSKDAVGVAVVNYKVPVCETHEEVMANCHRIAAKVDATKRGYPGLDLIIFPEYSTQGFHPTKWDEFTTTLDGPEVEIFAQACVRNGVWGIFSITGERHPEGKNPFNTLVMINPQGQLALTYRKMFPWVPKEPWTAGSETAVAAGPKGLVVGGTICYDCNLPEICRDTAAKGAELIVRIQGYMYPSLEQQQLVARMRAWENCAYVAVANMAGSDLAYSYFGHSNIVDFDGSVIASATADPDAATYATLSLTALRDARRNWTAENHLYNLVHRGYTSEPGGHAACPFPFYRNWVTAPEVAKETMEALTRDADDPAAASEAEVEPPPQSRLWREGAKGADGAVSKAPAPAEVVANGKKTNGRIEERMISLGV